MKVCIVVLFRYLGMIVSFFLKNRQIFKIYNYVYEHSTHRVAKLFVKFIKVPDNDNLWTIKLLNGKKVYTKIYANDLKTAQFALSYKWHSPPLNFTEKILNEYYAIDIPWIDIGSNLGIRSLLSLTEKRPVYFIEPNSELNRLNIERCLLNHFENYILFEIGVSDKTGTIEFTIDKTSYNSSIENGKIPENLVDHKEIIKIDTIDNIFKDQLDNIKTACIKIDVEGHELNVIEGALVFISRLSPTMIVEVNQKGNHFSKFLNIFYDFDYEIFEIGHFTKSAYYKKIVSDESFNNSTLRNNDFLVIRDKKLIRIIEKHAVN